MKRIILSFTLCILAVSSFAQSSRFQQTMQTNLALFDSLKTPDNYVSLAASFERIADAEKTQWLPYYYAALSHILRGFSDTKANKDEVAEKADALIAKAEAIDPKNSEIFVLKSMAATLHMLVDPQARYMQYGPKSSAALATAKQLDPNNPRTYYMEAQGIFGMPEQFGGGKEKAKPIFEKSVALFNSQKPASPIYPQWGKSTAENMLAQCQ